MLYVKGDWKESKRKCRYLEALATIHLVVS